MCSEIIKKILVKLRTELNLAPGLMLNKHLVVTGARITGLAVNTIGIKSPSKMVSIYRSSKSLNCNNVDICILLTCMLM